MGIKTQATGTSSTSSKRLPPSDATRINRQAPQRTADQRQLKDSFEAAKGNLASLSLPGDLTRSFEERAFDALLEAAARGHARNEARTARTTPGDGQPPEPPSDISPDPALPAGTKAARQGTIQGGELFRGPDGGVSYDDVEQGSLGDCAFNSAMVAVARHDPDAIRRIIRENPDGTYTVTFFKPQKDPTKWPDNPADWQTVQITVDADLPLGADGKPLFSHSRDPKELWPSILEKAFAVYRDMFPKEANEPDGYGGIEGTHNGDAIMALVGGAYTHLPIVNNTVDQVWDTLQQADAAGKIITASTRGTDDFLTPKAFNDVGIVPGHAYAVLGTEVDPKTGERYVLLRNPWGTHEPGRGNDGIFKISVEHFQQWFLYAGIVDPKTPKAAQAPLPDDSQTVPATSIVSMQSALNMKTAKDSKADLEDPVVQWEKFRALTSRTDSPRKTSQRNGTSDQ